MHQLETQVQGSKQAYGVLPTGVGDERSVPGSEEVETSEGDWMISFSPWDYPFSASATHSCSRPTSGDQSSVVRGYSSAQQTA